MSSFKLLMKASLVTIINLARVVVKIQGVHLIGILAKVVILGQLGVIGLV